MVLLVACGTVVAPYLRAIEKYRVDDRSSVIAAPLSDAISCAGTCVTIGVTQFDSSMISRLVEFSLKIFRQAAT